MESKFETKIQELEDKIGEKIKESENQMDSKIDAKIQELEDKIGEKIK